VLSSRVVGVLVALAVVVPAAAPAEAVSAPTATRTFGVAIEAPAGWERENTCDPTEKKGPKKLRKVLDVTYGLVASNIVRACSRSDSGHEEGRALDWMVNVRVPEQKAMAESYLYWLSAPDVFGTPAAMARRLGISYVIWNNAMWRPATGAWTAYSDCAKPKRRATKYDNTCHRNHVHTSFSWDGALGRTSYYSGYVACPAPATDPWVPAVLPAAAEVVALLPVRVLGTRRGVGLPTGPCKVHPDVHADLRVLGVDGVPLTGVAAVQLRVAVSKPDARTDLRVWTAGTALPLAPVLTVEKAAKASTTVTVPVGPDGLVSLQTTGGMGHLRVDVTGYSVGAPA